MDYRPLGASGLKVPALSFGAGTFGGSGPLFGHWGNSDAKGIISVVTPKGLAPQPPMPKLNATTATSQPLRVRTMSILL